MIEVIQDTLIDVVKLIPFLFITYLIMEYIEHKTSKKVKDTIKKSGKLGPLIGSILGVFPQCGFSVSATNLYAARVITLGTLIAVYLSTSDEMLPIFISEAVPVGTILTILAIKLVIGMIAGFLIDFVMSLKKDKQEDEKIIDLCEKEHCHCENGIVKSSIKHTLSISLFILIITFVINTGIYFIGEETISQFLSNQPILRTNHCRINWINSKLWSICNNYSNVFRKCYFSWKYDFRFISRSWSWTCCSF